MAMPQPVLRTAKGRVFYPDLIWQGGLRQALDAALCAIGSPLRVVGSGADRADARIESGRRFCQIFLPARFKRFSFECWDQDACVLLGVFDQDACLARGDTWSLTGAAQAIDRWVRSDCTAAALASEFPFVEPLGAAAAYAAGGALEYAWQTSIAGATERMRQEHWQWEKWDPFVLAASQRPQLRQLFPWMSTGVFLSFSRCTLYPFTSDVPCVTCLGEGYTVYDAMDFSRTLGCGGPEYAADLIVRYLPPDCGPAIIGNAVDLAREIAVREGGAVEDVLRRIAPHVIEFAIPPWLP